MHPKEIERFAFLYLCGHNDRELLVGKKEKMKFMDFERLAYITDFLGLDHLNLELWNEYFDQFREQLEVMEQMEKEPYIDEESGEFEGDVQLHEQWLSDFFASVPDHKTKKYLSNMIEFDGGE